MRNKFSTLLNHSRPNPASWGGRFFLTVFLLCSVLSGCGSSEDFEDFAQVQDENQVQVFLERPVVSAQSKSSATYELNISIEEAGLDLIEKAQGTIIIDRNASKPPARVWWSVGVPDGTYYLQIIGRLDDTVFVEYSASNVVFQASQPVIIGEHADAIENFTVVNLSE